MKWDEITIKVPGNRTVTGNQARSWVSNEYPGLVSTKVHKAVVLIGKDKRTIVGAAAAELLYKLLGDSVQIAGVRRPQPPPVVRVRRREPNVVRRDPGRIAMFLDVNRDGQIDGVPAANDAWTWGPDGRGAILAVKTRVYQPANEVAERSEVRFSWAGDVAVGWEAELAIDQPTRARVYRGRREDADLLLGGAQAGPLALHADNAFRGAIDRRETVTFWMDAPAYPTTAQEADYLVTLTFTFRHLQRQVQQVAVLRIAPWLMASDLATNAVVYARGTVAGNAPSATVVARNALSDAIGLFVGDVFVRHDVAANRPSKGFARDVMKSGYVQTPHYSGVAIQDYLDMVSPLCGQGGIALDAGPRVHAGQFRMPPNLVQASNTGQDNGGNLLVSPPSDDYPFGRIIYGTAANADFVNNSATFYAASMVQAPIVLDSTWLRVGHVDEMFTFVRCGDGSYKALLMSPRLAYIMLYAVASTTNDAINQVIDDCVQVNNARIQAGRHQANTLDAALVNFAPLRQAPAMNQRFRLAAVGQYDPDPAVPANTDGWVVFRTDVADTATALGARMQEVGQVTQGGAQVFEIQSNARHFIDNMYALAIADGFQPFLDDARAALRDELGFVDADIIEVPVLLNVEAGFAVALTADSVNMIVLAGNPASRCLVPKPFGPVYAGAYIFEAYLTQALDALGVDYEFLCDDHLHVMEGEIHCGTNQVPVPLAIGIDAPKWWRWVEPP